MPRIELGGVAGGTGAVAGGPGVPAPRVIERRTGLPGGRAALGALLIAIAAVGVFLAYAGAEAGPTDEVVIATRQIQVGATIGPDDVRVARGDLPSGASGATFSSLRSVVGHVALGPIGSGEIVQASAITADTSAIGGTEVSITLPRDQIAVGRLKQGERVDVYVTYDTHTSSVVRGAQVVMIATGRDGSLTSERELSVVISVPSSDVVAALVHALRTGEVTVVRSTFAAVETGEPVSFDAGRARGE